MMLHEALTLASKNPRLMIKLGSGEGPTMPYRDAYMSAYSGFSVLRPDWEVVDSGTIIFAAERFLRRRPTSVPPPPPTPRNAV